MSDIELQGLYNEAVKRGMFTADPDMQQIGHQMRLRGMVSDPTQGGLMTPNAPLAQPATSATHAPLFDVASQMSGTVSPASSVQLTPGNFPQPLNNPQPIKPRQQPKFDVGASIPKAPVKGPPSLQLKNPVITSPVSPADNISAQQETASAVKPKQQVMSYQDMLSNMEPTFANRSPEESAKIMAEIKQKGTGAIPEIAQRYHNQDIVAANEAGNKAYSNPGDTAAQQTFEQLSNRVAAHATAHGQSGDVNLLTSPINAVAGADVANEAIKATPGWQGTGAELLRGLADPMNMGIIATLPIAHPIIQKLTAAAFSGLMGKGAYDAAQDTDLQKSDPVKYYGNIAVAGGMAALPILHAALNIPAVKDALANRAVNKGVDASAKNSGLGKYQNGLQTATDALRPAKVAPESAPDATTYNAPNPPNATDTAFKPLPPDHPLEMLPKGSVFRTNSGQTIKVLNNAPGSTNIALDVDGVKSMVNKATAAQVLDSMHDQSAQIAQHIGNQPDPVAPTPRQKALPPGTPETPTAQEIAPTPTNTPKPLTPKEQAYVDQLSKATAPVADVPRGDIQRADQHFQFRRGTSSDFPSWNVEQAAKNPISVWVDKQGEIGQPGQTYVVNGHHRFVNAEKFDVPMMRVRYIDAPTAADAKHMGAVENLMDSPRNDSLDVAHFLRNAPMRQGDAAQFLRDNGVNSSGALMRQSVSLTKLPQDVFNEVYSKSDVMPQLKNVAAAIADNFHTPEEQTEQFNDAYQRMQQGQKVTADQIEEKAKAIAAVKAAQAQGGLDFDLGDMNTRADVVSAIKDHFGKLIKTGKGMSKDTAQSFFGTTPEQIDKATMAAQVGEIIDKNAHSSSPLGRAVTDAVHRISAGENRNEVVGKLTNKLESGGIIRDTLGEGKSDAGTQPTEPNQNSGVRPDVQETQGGISGDLFGGNETAPTNTSNQVDPAYNGPPTDVAQSASTEPKTTDAIRAKLDALEKTHYEAGVKSTGQLNSFADPAAWYHAAVVGAVKIARGALDVADWSKEMIDTFGIKITPYLNDLWQASREHYTHFVQPLFPEELKPLADTESAPAAKGEQSTTPEQTSVTKPTEATATSVPVSEQQPGSVSGEGTRTETAETPTQATQTPVTAEPTPNSTGSRIIESHSGKTTYDVPEGVTGGRNAAANLTRAEDNLTPLEQEVSKGHEDTYNRVREKLLAQQDGGRAYAEGLSNDVLKNGKALNDDETSAIIFRATQERQLATRQESQIAEAVKSGDTNLADALRSQLAQTNDRLQHLDDARQKGGTAAARGISIRQLFVNQNTGNVESVQGMLTARNHGNPLSDAQKALAQDIADKTSTLQAKLDAVDQERLQYKAEIDRVNAENAALKAQGTKSVRTATNRILDPTSEKFGASNKLVAKSRGDELGAKLAASWQDALARSTTKGSTGGKTTGMADINPLSGAEGSLASKAGALTKFISENKSEIGEYGAYLIEGGLRNIKDFGAEMLKQFPGATLEHIQTMWTNAKSDLNNRSAGIAQKPADTFVDSLAKTMGRKGATDFVNDLNEKHPEAFGKILRGETLTDDEYKDAAALKAQHTPVSNPAPTVKPEGVQTLQDIVADVKAKTAEKAKADALAARTPEQVFRDDVGARIGKDNGNKFVDSLNPDLKAKLLAGKELTPAEQLQVAKAYADARPKGSAEPKSIPATVQAVKDSVAAAQKVARDNAATEKAKADKVAKQAKAVEDAKPENVFRKAMARSLGKDNADAFIKSIDPDTMSHLLGDGKLTPEQEKALSDAYDANRKAAGVPQEQGAAQKALMEARANVRKAAQDAARQDRQSKSDADKADRAAAASTPENQLKAAITRSLGKEGADKFYAQSNPEDVKALIDGTATADQKQTLAKLHEDIKSQKPATTPALTPDHVQDLRDATADVRKQTATKQQIDALNKEIATGERPAAAAARAAKPVSPELQAAQDELARLRAIVKPGRLDQQQIANLTKRLADEKAKTEQIKAGTYTPEQKQKMREYSAQATELRSQLSRQVAENRARIKAATPMTAMDYLLAWQHMSLLSRPSTLAKLGMAAAERTAISPVEELIGGGLNRIAPDLSAKAQVEGKLVPKAEALALQKVFQKSTYKGALQKINSGQNILDKTYGDKTFGTGAKLSDALLPKGEGRNYRGFLDFFGNLHGAIKTPAQHAAFARAFEKISQSMPESTDLTDPRVQMQIGTRAYLESKRAIFMQDNAVSHFLTKTIRGLENSTEHPTVGKIGAAALRIAAPIVKVPTNYIGEVGHYLGGLAEAPARQLAAKIGDVRSEGGRLTGDGVKGSVKYIADIIKNKSADSMTPEQADAVVRAYKKGGLGAGLVALGVFGQKNGWIKLGGYYEAGKKDPNGLKPGDISIDGYVIPHLILHHPAFEALQWGGQMAKSWQQTAGSWVDKAGHGALVSGAGTIENAPFLREVTDATRALRSDKDAGRFLGNAATSIAVPGIVQQAAAGMDTTKTGQPIPRNPRGFKEQVKMAIPGLRQQVPVKAGKGGGFKTPGEKPPSMPK